MQNSGIFHDSTRPHIYFDGMPPKSRRTVVLLLRVRYKYYEKQSFWFGLEPPTRRSRSKSVHECIPYNNRCVQNFIQIGRDLAVIGPKTCFGVKTELPSLCLAVNNNCRAQEHWAVTVTVSCCCCCCWRTVYPCLPRTISQTGDKIFNGPVVGIVAELLKHRSRRGAHAAGAVR